jgi:hypothetical protein
VCADLCAVYTRHWPRASQVSWRSDFVIHRTYVHPWIPAPFFGSILLWLPFVFHDSCFPLWLRIARLETLETVSVQGPCAPRSCSSTVCLPPPAPAPAPARQLFTFITGLWYLSNITVWMLCHIRLTSSCACAFVSLCLLTAVPRHVKETGHKMDAPSRDNGTLNGRMSCWFYTKREGRVLGPLDVTVGQVITCYCGAGAHLLPVVVFVLNINFGPFRGLEMVRRRKTKPYLGAVSNNHLPLLVSKHFFCLHQSTGNRLFRAVVRTII